MLAWWRLIVARSLELVLTMDCLNSHLLDCFMRTWMKYSRFLAWLFYEHICLLDRCYEHTRLLECFDLNYFFVWLFLMTFSLVDDCCTCFKHLLSWTLGWLLHLVMHWMCWKMMGVEHCRKCTWMTNDKFNVQVTTDLI